MVTRWDPKTDADTNDRAYSGTSRGLAIPQKGAAKNEEMPRKPARQGSLFLSGL